MITQAELRLHLNYDADTGIFTRIKPTRGVALGSVAGHQRKNKQYISIGINQKQYLAHVLAWIYVYGNKPEGDIDHINQVKFDNRIKNLRVVTRSENNQNRSKANKRNNTGHKGVHQIYTGKYRVHLMLNRKNIHLGYFKTLEDAISARKAGEILHHPCSPVNYAGTNADN